MVEWLAHYTCNLEAPSSSPTMAASWICSWQSLVQILGQVCKKPTGLTLTGWDF